MHVHKHLNETAVCRDNGEVRIVVDRGKRDTRKVKPINIQLEYQ